MSHVRGVVMEYSQAIIANDKGEFVDVCLTIEEQRHHGYVKKGEDHLLLREKEVSGCLVEFLTATQNGKEFIKLDSLQIIAGKTNSITEPQRLNNSPIGTTLSIEEVRAYALMSAANMVGRLTGTQLKREDVIKVADEFVEYILKGGK